MWLKCENNFEGRLGHLFQAGGMVALNPLNSKAYTAFVVLFCPKVLAERMALEQNGLKCDRNCHNSPSKLLHAEQCSSMSGLKAL